MCMHRSSAHWRLWLTGGLLACAVAVSCAPATVSSGAPGAAADATRSDQQRTLVPAGYGTLKQDEITVSIRSGPVLVKVTPLDEAVIRLVAPDTYQRLSALATSRRAEAARNTPRSPELFLVSFFSYQPDVVFQPADLQLFHQARLIRPSAILPITAGWGRERLGQQESQTAIYSFEGPIDYAQAMRVRYGTGESDEWTQIISRLETERSKVLARVRT